MCVPTPSAEAAAPPRTRAPVARATPASEAKANRRQGTARTQPHRQQSSAKRSSSPFLRPEDQESGNEGSPFKRHPMDSRGPRAEAGFAGRERQPRPASLSTQGGGSWGKPGFPHALIADVNVVVVVGEREGRPAQAE